MKTINIMKLLVGSFLVVGCGMPTNQPRSDAKEAWNEPNQPSLFDGAGSYQTQFVQLPLQSTLSTQPWSGDYWPTHKGGISYRWNGSGMGVERYNYPLIKPQDIKGTDLRELSPAEKYNLYLGRWDFPLVNHERQRTGIIKTVPGSEQYDPEFEIPTWEGLCHAWAPATLGYTEPAPVELKSVDGIVIPFGSSDIKALLTFFLHTVPTPAKFVGERCNLPFYDLVSSFELGEMTKADLEAQMNTDACRDVNAGAFHLILTNEIGLNNSGFVADVTRDLEVWNQAIEGYESTVSAEKLGASEGAAPGTVREVVVDTTMAYTVEVDSSWEGETTCRGEQESRPGTDYAYYQYRLELDDAGQIIGGAWQSQMRPDFLWMRPLPEFSGYFSALETIYRESIAGKTHKESGSTDP